MIRLVMTAFVSLSLVVVATTQEKDSQQTDQAERADKLGQQGNKPDNNRRTAEQSQRTELPELFAPLELNEQQKQSILAIYRESDQKSEEIWNRVQDLHRQAISMEACAMAAARLEGHDHGAHEGKAGQPTKVESDRKPNPQTGNRTGAANTENVRKTNRPDNRSTDESKTADQNKLTLSGIDGELNVVAIRVGIAQPDGRVREYLLTQPNSQADKDSDPTFTTHTSQLTKVWKDIHDGHEELVALEADTIVKVEAQLTESQLQKLDATQSHASNTSKSSNDDAGR